MPDTLQARISELPPANRADSSDGFEVQQGAFSRRMSHELLKASVAPDLSPYMTGIIPGTGIVIAGSAPVMTVSLQDLGGGGTYGDGGNVPTITVDEYGRVTHVALTPIPLPDLSAYAPLDSPALTGLPTAPTRPHGESNTRLANTAFVQQEIAAIPAPDFTPYAPKNSPALTGNPTAPTPAPGDADTSIATTAFVAAAIGAYAPLASPALTGNPTAPTPAPGDADTSIATTGFVAAAIGAIPPPDLTAYAPKDSPALTGTPTAPTPAASDNDTSIATTAFVRTALTAGAGSPPDMLVDNARPGPTNVTFPYDDTIPQIGEGVRLWQRTFTATNPANPIEVDADIDFGGSGNPAHAVTALFIDNGPNAVATRVVTCNTQWFAQCRLRWRGVLAAGQHTFEIRYGTNSGYVSYNRVDALVYGGSIQSTVSISEIGVGVAGPPGPPGPIGGYQTGDTITSYRAIASEGWIIADDGTIGDASSGATTRANADCQNLFNLFWPNANCTIAGGKGASAAADWGAHKALSLPKVLSRVLGVAGAAGAGGLTARGVAEAVGVESATTSGDNSPQGTGPPPGGWVLSGSGHTHSVNVMQPSAFLKLHIKL